MPCVAQTGDVHKEEWQPAARGDGDGDGMSQTRLRGTHSLRWWRIGTERTNNTRHSIRVTLALPIYLV
jgi:hypothetical protein